MVGATGAGSERPARRGTARRRTLRRPCAAAWPSLRLLASRATPVSARRHRPRIGAAPVDDLRAADRAGRRRIRGAPAGRAAVGPRAVAFEIGTAYLRGEPLERAGRPVLARLCVTLGARRTWGCCTARRRCTSRRTRRAWARPTLVTEVGVRLPAALTATGLSILAHLPGRAGPGAVPGPGGVRGPDRVAGRTPLPALRRDLAAVRRRGWAIEDGRVSAGHRVGRRPGVRPQRASRSPPSV